MSEVQNQQQGGQQQPQEVAGQAQDAAGRATQQAQDTTGQVTDQAGQAAGQVQDAAGQATDQAQNVAGQATDQAGQVVGQAQDAMGGLIGGAQGNGQGAGQSGEQEMDDYSYNDTDATTIENDKTPKGVLGQLLNLDILPSPTSDTTTLDSGDSADYYGPDEAQQEEAQA